MKKIKMASITILAFATTMVSAKSAGHDMTAVSTQLSPQTFIASTKPTHQAPYYTNSFESTSTYRQIAKNHQFDCANWQECLPGAPTWPKHISYFVNSRTSSQFFARREEREIEDYDKFKPHFNPGDVCAGCGPNPMWNHNFWRA